MPADKYELIALGARYWFAFLGVIIVWRSFRWLRKDARQRRKRLKQLPDAGLVGELVVLAGNETLPPGTVIPLPREGTLGSLRSCDISIPCGGVAPRHCDFRFENGVGLILSSTPNCALMVDGQEPDAHQREWVMHHGSRLLIGDALLRMRLFMGLETARSASFQLDMQEDGPPEMAVAQEAWRQEMDGQEDDTNGVYQPPAPVVMEDHFDPNWEEYTRPHRQLIRTWQDTGRYGSAWQRQMPPDADPAMEAEEAEELEAPEDMGEMPGQWAGNPYAQENNPPSPWQGMNNPYPPVHRRSLFHRRRR